MERLGADLIKIIGALLSVRLPVCHNFYKKDFFFIILIATARAFHPLERCTEEKLNAYLQAQEINLRNLLETGRISLEDYTNGVTALESIGVAWRVNDKEQEARKKRILEGMGLINGNDPNNDSGKAKCVLLEEVALAHILASKERE